MTVQDQKIITIAIFRLFLSIRTLKSCPHEGKIDEIVDQFPFVPPPPHYVIHPQLQST